MYNKNERGLEFPVTSDRDEAAATSSVVTFRSTPGYSEIFAPIIGASSHLADSRYNYQHGTGLTGRVKELASDPVIEDGLGHGWIVGAPEHTAISNTDTGVDLSTQLDCTKIRNATPRKTGENEPTDPIIVLRIPWAPDIQDGYSLLVTKPFLSTPVSEGRVVLSHLIDADNVETYIDVPLLFYGYSKAEKLEFKHGEPIARIIPIPRTVYDVETRFMPPKEQGQEP